MSRVDVYRNLTKRCWSVRENGKVVDHVEAIALEDVSFRVSEAARQRVLRLGQRAVLAWATGLVTDTPMQPGSERIKFDPFEMETFRSGTTPVFWMSLAHFDRNGRCWGVFKCVRF